MKNKSVSVVELSKDEIKTYTRIDSIVRNNGYDPEVGHAISVKDALAIQSSGIFVPRVLTEFVQEGVEPLLIGSQLLQRIEYQPGLQTVFPAVDVLQAREVGDGMALPIFNIHTSGAQSYGVNVQRHGLALRVNEKFLQQTTWPWMQYWMKLAGHALARHKEERIFNFITKMGAVAFDNSTAARQTNAAVQPVLGHTTGRNLKGQFNGSTTMDDIFDMYAMVLLQGFIPDTILVHPMSFLMWVKDPVMREFALTAGGGSFFGNWTGAANAQSFGGQFNSNGLGQGLGQTGQYRNGALTGGQTATVQGLPQNLNTAPILPSYLGIPFRILVSPFVYFDPTTKTTNFMMFDSKNLGALIVAADPHVNTWDEQLYGIHNVGIEEEYGFGILNEGQGIAVAKNIRVKSNEFILPARTVFDIASSTTFEGTSSYDQDGASFGSTPTDVNSR
jgi:hypothetical protein